MSGHSHWATIKHKKGAIDAKRGKLWSKLSRAIIIAARHGGGDPTMNLKLRYAIDKARAVSACPRTTSSGPSSAAPARWRGCTFEEITYEGFGPGGVAVLVDVLTDNRNRTNGEVRKIFERGGGNMGSAGCVGYLFERKGVFSVHADGRGRGHAHGHRPGRRGRRPEARRRHLRDHLRPGVVQQGAGGAAEEPRRRRSMAEISQVPKAPVDVDAGDGHARCCA